MPSRPRSVTAACNVRRVLPLLAIAAAAACGSHATPAASSAAAPPATSPTVRAGALAAYAGHPLVVFPLQHVTGDSTANADSLLQRFDDAFAGAARSRSVATGWAMAVELERSARRNPGYVVDPRTLTVGGLGSHRTDDAISGVLGGEVRATVALHDARYAVVPYVLRIAADGEARTAAASLVVIDARLARVLWRADITGRGATDAAAVTAAAEHVADLFVAP